MARNGSGTYSLPAGQPVVTGTTISSTTFNTLTSDLANALTQSLASDGQTTPTANLPMGGYKHTGVANGSARTDYPSFGQLQDGVGTWLSSVSGADTITASVSTPTLTAYAAGQVFRFVAAGTNTTAVTLNINSIGAKAVTKNGTTALASGDIQSASVVTVAYDGTQFQLVNVANLLTASSTTTLTNKTLLASGPNTVEATSAPASSAFTLRNKLINGAMNVDQRNAGASQTFTAAAALAYSVDRWYGYCTGANVTGQRVAGTAPNAYNYQFTGAALVTKIGFAQRIEALNCQDLAGQTATLSVDLANSVLTTVTWTAWYANTADTFGTLASPTRTQIATGTWTVSSTLTRYNAQISVPAAATTGIEIEFSVGAQTSGTWTIGRAQFEQGGTQTPFEYRPATLEFDFCQRYYQTFVSGTREFAQSCYLYSTYANAASASAIITIPFNTVMRATPTMTKIGTWNVANTNQPSLVATSPGGFYLQIVSLAAGTLNTNTNNAGAGWSAAIEL